ncbi:hypothetical protein [Haloterrigena salinisoli]|uniref:DUF7511 domain-containing protein n=1 Tax=Haloterrigena salinisoli TaxID=3132747 RepID=UPI0030CA6513
MTPDADTARQTDASLTELDHVTIENDDAPDECAIFPREASDEKLDSAWIVAYDDGFVPLESMR